MKKIIPLLLVLALVLSLVTGAMAAAPSKMNNGIRNYCQDMDYPLTEEMMETIRQGVPSQPVETPLLTLRSVDVAYDGMQLVVSANILPKEGDVELISFAVTPDEMVEGTTQTYRERAAAAGRRLLTVECVPTCLEEEGVYFLESYQEEDGSISIVTGGSLEAVGASLSFGYHLRLYDMDGKGDLLDEVVGETEAAPLLPMETAVYHLPEKAGISTLTLTRTFFGTKVDPSNVELLDEAGNPVKTGTLGDGGYAFLDALPEKITVKLNGETWIGER